MPHVRRPTYTRPTPTGDGVKRVTVRVDGKDVPCVRWTARDKRVITAPLSADGRRCTVTLDVFYGYYTDHAGQEQSVKLHRDKRASERALDEIVIREQSIAQGDISAASARRRDRLAVELVEEWAAAMKADGNSKGHVKAYKAKVIRVLDALETQSPARLTADAVTALLASWRSAGLMGQQNSNHILTAVHAFTRWCVPRYLDADPMHGARPVPVTKRKFERRPLTPEELDRLVTATAGRYSRCAVPSRDRAVAYLVVVYTGFRLAELARLTPASFRLDDDPPVVILGPSKGKPGCVQVLPEAIVPRLREYLKDKPATRRLWHGSMWADKSGASDVLKRDLAAAGIPYKDETGRVVNFHALRTTYATWLARAGVPIQHAQRLLRHSDPRTTMAHYVRLGLSDYLPELAKLPRPPDA
jgi:integrase